MSPVLVGSMHQKAADAGRVLGVLADADVDLVVVDDRRADEVVAGAGAAELVDGVLGVAVELPDQLAGLGAEAVEPAVAAGEDDLPDAVDLARRPGWTTGRA